MRLEGDPSPREAASPEDRLAAVARDALGATVRVTAVIRGERVTQSRQLIGIGGHQGKQMDFVVHVGLGDAERAERVEIEWPARGGGDGNRGLLLLVAEIGQPHGAFAGRDSRHHRHARLPSRLIRVTQGSGAQERRPVACGHGPCSSGAGRLLSDWYQPLRV
ncbi:MAG: hypothetical protein HND58_03960 [Planctomycetota bacterium]|nr:MAG: hypothetical protein HND58_03960 [Planctomycetota bacterium]